VQTQVPGLPTQEVCGAVQVPQVTGLPQLSVDIPHCAAVQWVLVGMQPQTPGLPATPLQTLGAVHEPQSMVPPQPSGAEPQLLLPHAWARVKGTQLQTPGVPPSVEQTEFAPVQMPQL
jgi:hypothetical protein